MIDFFDEDFPLTEKQAEEEKRRLNEGMNAPEAVEPEMAVNNEDDLQESGNPLAAGGIIAESSADENCIDETLNETAGDTKTDGFAETEQAEQEGESIFSFNFPLPGNAKEYEPERSLAEIAEINDNIGEDITEPNRFEYGAWQNSRNDESVQQDYIEPESIAEEDADAGQEDDFLPEQLAGGHSAAEIGVILSDQSVFSASTNESEDLSAVRHEDTFLPAAESAENPPAESDGGSDISEETETSCPVSGVAQTVTDGESAECLTYLEPDNISEPGGTESEESADDFDEESALPPMLQQEVNSLTDESASAATGAEPCAEQQKILTHSEISAEIEEAVSSAINLHIETFIRGFKPTEGEADKALREELSRLSKKLDNVEKAVGAVEVPLADESDSQGFTYEYDERYFAEEETPAYKYPGLYKKNPGRSREKPASSSKRQADKAPKPQSFDKSTGNITVNTKTLLKMGAMVAATAAAVKFLGKKND